MNKDFLEKENDIHGSSHVKCIHCECKLLHQFKVEVFFRKEDNINGLHAIIDESGIEKNIKKNNQVYNPSSRRNGIIIHFYCEHCKKVSLLHIVQHKGCTYIDASTVKEYKSFVEENIKEMKDD